MIELKHIVKEYNKKVVLDDIKKQSSILTIMLYL